MSHVATSQTVIKPLAFFQSYKHHSEAHTAHLPQRENSQLHTNFVEQEVAAYAGVSFTTGAAVFAIAALLRKRLDEEVWQEGELGIFVKWVCCTLRQFSTCFVYKEIALRATIGCGGDGFLADIAEDFITIELLIVEGQVVVMDEVTYMVLQSVFLDIKFWILLKFPSSISLSSANTVSQTSKNLTCESLARKLSK
ncbi:hypothetical protein Acr_25g0007350 [Actinidia rufa]|uniref:Uncharacterized protein n=1 Tax=Actinidia rufa TaxID=165716 RepID=A0A7J0GZV4_9ERIC|nr:hypothetical protein Acr_25g0007350 [Actinidia rufa]